MEGRRGFGAPGLHTFVEMEEDLERTGANLPNRNKVFPGLIPLPLLLFSS